MQLVTTADGSHTLYAPLFGEHYHSTFGALTESWHVFIGAVKELMTSRTRLTIFEAGFGTGLNALLTCITAMEYRLMVTYHGAEKYPVECGLSDQLNYASLLPSDHDPRTWFERIHRAPWNETRKLHPFFYLHKIKTDLTSYQPDFSYDLIFYDAFAPEKQPEMWSRELFEKLYTNLNTGGILATYCVKGEVRRMLKSAGFRVTKIPGPPGKREVLRAWKD